MSTKSPEQLEAQISQLRSELDELKRQRIPVAENSGEEEGSGVALVCFSGEWDRLFAAFTIANGALAMGQEVHMFFTFWGATAVRQKNSLPAVKQHWMQKMMGRMLPADISKSKLSHMHFCGLGKKMLGILMRQQNIQDLPSLMQDARDLGAQFYYCDTSVGLFGWGNHDLVDGEDSKWCGVTTFLSAALKGKITLFI